jgi:hypothetical protein
MPFGDDRAPGLLAVDHPLNFAAGVDDAAQVGGSSASEEGEERRP